MQECSPDLVNVSSFSSIVISSSFLLTNNKMLLYVRSYYEITEFLSTNYKSNEAIANEDLSKRALDLQIMQFAHREYIWSLKITKLQETTSEWMFYHRGEKGKKLTQGWSLRWFSHQRLQIHISSLTS